MDNRTYAERLNTFEGFWEGNEATARQLAAIGHVFDRPPLEAQGEFSRCISCSSSVAKDLSIRALESNDARKYRADFSSCAFHSPSCIRLQVKIPLEPQAILAGLYGSRINDLKRRFERNSATDDARFEHPRASQNSHFFDLPTEIRLQIYGMILPSLETVTEIVTLNRDSPRVVTSAGYNKTGPRDTTKPSLLRTCKAIHDEAMDLLYSNTTFKFESTKVMYLFLRSIGSTGRLLIESVDVACGNREDAIAFALLGSCKNLQRICIGLRRPVLLFSRPPLWLLDGVSCLLDLNGMKEVEFRDSEPSIKYISKSHPDLTLIRNELMRPRGTPSSSELKSHLST